MPRIFVDLPFISDSYRSDAPHRYHSSHVDTHSVDALREAADESSSISDDTAATTGTGAGTGTDTSTDNGAENNQQPASNVGAMPRPHVRAGTVSRGHPASHTLSSSSSTSSSFSSSSLSSSSSSSSSSAIGPILHSGTRSANEWRVGAMHARMQQWMDLPTVPRVGDEDHPGTEWNGWEQEGLSILLSFAFWFSVFFFHLQIACCRVLLLLSLFLFADSHVFADAYHDDDEDDDDGNDNRKAKKQSKSSKKTNHVGSGVRNDQSDDNGNDNEDDNDDDEDEDEDEHTVHIDEARMTPAERMAHARAAAMTGLFLRLDGRIAQQPTNIEYLISLKQSLRILSTLAHNKSEYF
jgi:hypothetical protein